MDSFGLGAARLLLVRPSVSARESGWPSSASVRCIAVSQHRRSGIMSEASRAMIDTTFAGSPFEQLRWEAF